MAVTVLEGPGDQGHITKKTGVKFVGSNTWDRYEMRVYKRLIEVDTRERVMRSIMRIRVPNEVYIEMEIR